MKIEKVDKNFDYNPIDGKVAVDVYDIPHPNFNLCGVFFDEKADGFIRLDRDVAESVNENIKYLNTNTAGGRICFSTDSDVVRIDVDVPGLNDMIHMPKTGSSAFSLLEITENGEKLVRIMCPSSENTKGFIAEAWPVHSLHPETAEQDIKNKVVRNYVLYFPLYNPVSRVKVMLRKGSIVKKYNYRDVKPILYYGSSITQGGCASRPDNCYQALIIKKNNIDFINLGFSGNCKAEPIMVDYLTTIDCSLFVCDYDHNANTVEYLKDTHFALYERYRKAKPDTPILFVTRPDLKGTKDDYERIKVVKSTYLKAKRMGDKNVYFLSGKRFFHGDEVGLYTVDGCHPTDHGFYYMAKEIYKKMVEIDPIFK